MEEEIKNNFEAEAEDEEESDSEEETVAGRKTSRISEIYTFLAENFCYNSSYLKFILSQLLRSCNDTNNVCEHLKLTSKHII